MSARPWAARRPLLWALAAVLLGGALVYGAMLFAADVREAVARLRGFPASGILGPLALVSAAYALRLLRWHLYLRWSGAPVPIPVSGLSFFTGFALTVTPGRLGELVKVYHVRHQGEPRYGPAFGGVVAERALDALSLVLLLAAGLVASGVTGAMGLLVLAGCAAVVLGLRSRRLAEPVLRFLAIVPGVHRVAPGLRAIHGHLRPLLRGRALGLGLGIGLASWGLEVIAVVWLSIALGIPIGWEVAAAAFAGGILAGAITMVPGGLGVAEGGMVAILASFGVPMADALALTLLVRLSTLWYGVGLGLVASLLLRRRLAVPPAPRPTATGALDE